MSRHSARILHALVFVTTLATVAWKSNDAWASDAESEAWAEDQCTYTVRFFAIAATAPEAWLDSTLEIKELNIAIDTETSIGTNISRDLLWWGLLPVGTTQKVNTIAITESVPVGTEVEVQWEPAIYEANTDGSTDFGGAQQRTFSFLCMGEGLVTDRNGAIFADGAAVDLIVRASWR